VEGNFAQVSAKKSRRLPLKTAVGPNIVESGNHSAAAQRSPRKSPSQK